MAVLLEVGLYGIENKIEAPAPIEENIYIMTAEERKEAGITGPSINSSQRFESFDRR
ncbi:glutamate-ammonia ligase [Streptococcus pneumoniae]|nr:glutamate-ammonia ligase [Streptococcus pneumoniae]